MSRRISNLDSIAPLRVNSLRKARSIHRLPSALLSLLGTLGLTSLAIAQPASAEPVGVPLLVAQQIVEGLPPPPPLAMGQEASVQTPTVTVPNLPAAAPAVPAPMSPPASDQRYAVVINGDSSLLLSQVQRVQSDASILDYGGHRVIQAGIFADAASAQQQVAALASQGIGAQVVSLSGSGQSVPVATRSSAPVLPTPDTNALPPPSREVEFGQPSNVQSAPGNMPALNPAPASPPDNRSLIGGPPSSHAYYVVIPGREQELDAIANQIIRLGDGFGIAQLVQTGNAPRGPHVSVGPFVNRDAASRWSRYLRDFGMNARVYYKR